jgi:RNA polymerase sigma factor (sigma-70 family)
MDTTPLLSPLQRGRVDENLGMVHACAAEIARRFRPRVQPDELLTPGTFGLFEAARLFDPERHPSFPYFAKCYVVGRMLDAVRVEHVSQRARVARNMERSFYRFAAHHVLDADTTNAPEEVLLEGARDGCDDALAAALLATACDAEAASPEDAIVMRVSVEKALGTLHAHEREAVRLVFQEAKERPEAARILRVHVNTVQNRLAAAMHKLRVFLADRAEDDT